VHRWWFQQKIAKRLLKLSAKVDKTYDGLVSLQASLKAQERSLLKAIRAVGRELETAQSGFKEIIESVDEVQLLQTNYKTETSKLREELRILEDVTVPNLIAANELTLERWNRAVADEIRAQTPITREAL
jgi:hypothetical protein